MNIAVTSEKENIFQHFGKSMEFTLMETEDVRIVDRKIIHKEESSTLTQAEFLKSHKVDLVICGAIGSGAKAALIEQKIEFVCGVKGPVIDAVIDYLSGLIIGDNECICTNFSYTDTNGCDCGCLKRLTN